MDAAMHDFDLYVRLAGECAELGDAEGAMLWLGMALDALATGRDN